MNHSFNFYLTPGDRLTLTYHHIAPIVVVELEKGRARIDPPFLVPSQ